MKASTLVSGESTLKVYRAPRTVVLSFTAKKIFKNALILGLIIGVYMYSKAYSFIKIYPTVASRSKIALTLDKSSSIQAMLGPAHNVTQVGGYLAWNFLCLVAAATAIWALIIATKYLRGEEDDGRWEQFLAGQTTARRATTQTLISLYGGLVIFFIMAYVFILIIGRLNTADLTNSSISYFSLALACGAVEFIAIGALASQLMPVRAKATTICVGIFGVFYVIRAIADTTTATWLLNLSPLGWIEKLQPMYRAQPIWLLPIAALVIICSFLAIILAGKRDLGEGIFKDEQNIKPRYSLLKGPFTTGLRLHRVYIFGWLASIATIAFVYGQLAKSNIINSLDQSDKTHKAIGHLLKISSTKSIGVVDFLAFSFFFVTLILMFYGANAVAQIRSDEAKGYLDNFVVQPISRVNWLVSRTILILIVFLLGLTISSLIFWLTQIGQNGAVTFTPLFEAGLNAAVPAVMVIAIGIFIYGLLPRLATILSYCAIAWSFLILMLASGLNLNHWLVDTSILSHLKFAPAVGADWRANSVTLVASLGLILIGLVLFRNRDLAGD